MKDNYEEIMKKALEGGDYPKPILLEDLGRMYPTEKSKQKTRFGLYKCGFCGTNFKTCIYKINSGNIKSCGCYNKRRTKETHKTHGLGHTRLYNIWKKIKERVFTKTSKQYNDYGGRGIKMCDEWLDVQNFYNWAISNGYSDELSIDRIDNDGGYFPENCRWTTRIIQSRNQRISKANKTGYRGVNYDKGGGKYKACIKINKKQIYLGYFSTAVEGAIAYNNYIIENNLEGFILNKIPEGYEDD